METLSSLLEFAMLFTFGLSWPFAIVRTFRAKRVDGKSPVFAILVIIGYLCGIAAKLIGHKPLWLVAVYVIDTLLVATDLLLYFYYSWKNSRGDYDVENIMRILRKAILADGRVAKEETEILQRVMSICDVRKDPKAIELKRLLGEVLADGIVTQEESDAIASVLTRM